MGILLLVVKVFFIKVDINANSNVTSILLMVIL